MAGILRIKALRGNKIQGWFPSLLTDQNIHPPLVLHPRMAVCTTRPDGGENQDKIVIRMRNERSRTHQGAMGCLNSSSQTHASV